MSLRTRFSRSDNGIAVLLPDYRYPALSRPRLTLPVGGADSAVVSMVVLGYRTALTWTESGPTCAWAVASKARPGRARRPGHGRKQNRHQQRRTSGRTHRPP